MVDVVLPGLFARPALVLVVVGALLALAAEFGHRVGAHVHRDHDEPRRAVVVGTISPILGLGALVLAFTYAMAAERYDVRRDLIVEEANAIGTAWLRASY